MQIWDQKCHFFVFSTRNALFQYFLARILKNHCHVLNEHLRISVMAKFWEKTKIAWIWGQKCLIWVFLDWNLKTILSYLKSAPSNLSNCKISRKNITENQNCINLGTKYALFGYFWQKMPYWGHFSVRISNMLLSDLFGYFWARILKSYCHIRNQHPQICQKRVLN